MGKKVTELQIGMLALKKDKQVRESPGTGKGRDLIIRKVNLQVQVI